jgi:iron complex outermembrane recepter protein
MPYQQIHHYKAVLDNSWFLGDGNLKLLLGYQQNRRQEFEEEENPKECGLDFMLHTVNYDLHYLSPEMNGWKFSTGVNGMWQQSINKGTEFLIPAYHLFDYGVFVTVSKKIGKLNLSGGIRYDHRHLHSEALREEDDTDSHSSDWNGFVLNGSESNGSELNDSFRFQAFKRSFEGVTGSIGLAYEILPDFNLKLNLARGFRAPNISELSSNGVHEGTQRYELGNTSLKPENSWQFDLGLDYSSPIISAELSLFANRINHYIYSEKLADENNQPVLIDDTPAYQFTSGDARILGGEASIDIHPVEHLHIGNTFSYVNSVQLHRPSESKYLPFTPAPRWVSDVRYEFVCDGKTFDHLFVKLQMDCNLHQNHYFAANETETATPSYTLLNMYAGTDVKLHGKRLLSLYLSGENLTNRAYQNHLSRLKYLDVNQVTGRRGVYNMGRNFSIKIVVPIEL